MQLSVWEPRDKTYTKIIWPWNLYKTGHAALIHPGWAGHQRKPMSRLSSFHQLKLTSA